MLGSYTRVFTVLCYLNAQSRQLSSFWSPKVLQYLLSCLVPLFPKSHFHVKSFAPGLLLKQRYNVTRHDLSFTRSTSLKLDWVMDCDDVRVCTIASHFKIHHQAFFARNVLKPLPPSWCFHERTFFILCCFRNLSTIKLSICIFKARLGDAICLSDVIMHVGCWNFKPVALCFNVCNFVLT